MIITKDKKCPGAYAILLKILSKALPARKFRTDCLSIMCRLTVYSNFTILTVSFPGKLTTTTFTVPPNGIRPAL